MLLAFYISGFKRISIHFNSSIVLKCFLYCCGFIRILHIAVLTLQIFNPICNIPQLILMDLICWVRNTISTFAILITVSGRIVEFSWCKTIYWET